MYDEMRYDEISNIQSSKLGNLFMHIVHLPMEAAAPLANLSFLTSFIIHKINAFPTIVFKMCDIILYYHPKFWLMSS